MAIKKARVRASELALDENELKKATNIIAPKANKKQRIVRNILQ